MKKDAIVGYVMGTQVAKTVKVRVPQEVYLPKYKKVLLSVNNSFIN